MKKGKWLVWAFITAAVFVIARIVFQHFNVFGGTGFHPQGMYQFQGNGFSRGGYFQGGEGFHRMGRHGHMYGFGFGHIFLQAGMFVVGWIVWKLSNGNCIRKWIGIALMILALPKILVLPAILVAAYFAYKISRNGNASYAQTEAADFSSLDSHKLDYLDEWEKNIHKEEK